MADPGTAWFVPAVRERLRVATTADELVVAGERLCMAPAALAAALDEPGGRLLIDDTGNAVLLRREWADDGAAEAVIVSRAGVPRDHPTVLATAAGWGCDRVRHQLTGRTMAVPGPPADAPLADRFRYLAALAATRVEAAVVLAGDAGRTGTGEDGSPTAAADEGPHRAAVAVLEPLGLPVLGEERGDQPVPAGRPWIVLDPLDPIDGTGDVTAGLPARAFSAALVSEGRPVAGVVVDLFSGRRWVAAEGAGATRDGVPVSPRSGGTGAARRGQVTGCAAVDLCLVADGSVAGWHDIGRGSRVHDVAGGLAVLLAAGGVALTPEGRPLVLPSDPRQWVHCVAAPDDTSARELLRPPG